MNDIGSLYDNKHRFVVLREDVNCAISAIDKCLDSLHAAIVGAHSNCYLPSEVDKTDLLHRASNQLYEKNSYLISTAIPAIEREISNITNEIERLEREERERREREERERREREERERKEREKREKLEAENASRK